MTRCAPPWHEGRSDKREDLADFVAVLGLVTPSLLPMLASGFYGDEEANSLVTARFLAMKWQTLPGLILSDMVDWMIRVGRFSPLGGVGRVLFWAVDGNSMTYKIVLMRIVLLDSALPYALARRTAVSQGFAAVAVLVFSVTLQFRFYYEPILSNTALLPVVTALVFAALLWFVGYLESGRRPLLFLSVG